MEKQIKERPILFSGPMVRALLAGTKTQTRRVVKLPNGRVSKKPQPMPDYIGSWVNSSNSDLWAGFGSGEQRPDGVQNTVNTMRTGWFACPYGKVGDRLWVRETLYWDECGEEWCYQAGNDPVWSGRPNDTFTAPIMYGDKPAIPSIHMPREISRFLLEITAVRVERVQDISEADAVAEGIEKHPIEGWEPEYDAGCYKNYLWSEKTAMKQAKAKTSAEESYESLWESINGPDSWAANPWVWVVEFKVISPATTPTTQEGAPSRE